MACQLRLIKDHRLQMVAKHRINEVLFEIGMSEFQLADATSRPAQEVPNSPTTSDLSESVLVEKTYTQL